MSFFVITVVVLSVAECFRLKRWLDRSVTLASTAVALGVYWASRAAVRRGLITETQSFVLVICAMLVLLVLLVVIDLRRNPARKREARDVA